MKNVIIVILILAVLAFSMPLNAFAVDPVSAAVMANALAQALAAYGSSLGISLTFDVSSNDSIGSSMSGLWDKFQSDIPSANIPNYGTLANTVWATIYTKVNDSVGVYISDTVVPFFDRFFDWLCGYQVANLPKVSDYYSWPVVDGNYKVINAISGYDDFINQPIPFHSNDDNYSIRDYGFKSYIVGNTYYSVLDTNNTEVFSFAVPNANSGYDLYYWSDTVSQCYEAGYLISDDSYVGPLISVNVSSSYQGLYYNIRRQVGASSLNLPVYNSFADGFADVKDIFDGAIPRFSIQLLPYMGDSIPYHGRVYIPDYTDVNYAPLPYVGGLDIPWDSTIYGDGTMSLDNTQKLAIESDISSVIESDRALTLEGDQVMSNVIDTFHSLLPFTNLPSFNFNLSGIWYYVVQWVGSLGSWFSTLFTVWSHLPYAIYVPVYATAVITIVLGVYKRFFM